MNEKVEMNAKVARLTCAVLATVGLIGLSACGGGGGSSKNLQLTEANLYGAGAIGTYKQLAANSPNFGSITQSSNGNIDDISTDKVETDLEAGKLTVTVKDENDNVSLELDSRTDLYENINNTAWMDDEHEDFREGWSGDAWILAKQDGEDLVVSFAYVAWDDSDETNYLAGGYWFKSNETDGVTEVGTFGDAGPGSIFSYYDGQNSSWVRPTSGTATYLGSAEGAYVGPDGDGGVWWSRLMLTADFPDSSIDGCVGCVEADPDRNDSGVYIYSNIEDLKADRCRTSRTRTFISSSRGQVSRTTEVSRAS